MTCTVSPVSYHYLCSKPSLLSSLLLPLPFLATAVRCARLRRADRLPVEHGLRSSARPCHHRRCASLLPPRWSLATRLSVPDCRRSHVLLACVRECVRAGLRACVAGLLRLRGQACVRCTLLCFCCFFIMYLLRERGRRGGPDMGLMGMWSRGDQSLRGPVKVLPCRL